ncbi:transmembrane protein 154 [Siniperca chuatsi]|uniref:transmembrane protein 154 n=1 Tax=Siniperca chuatsi TaxID=119488 RepID=UPI001CE22307|nr:transmembrane protein 154 [Siniperca chuatsi]
MSASWPGRMRGPRVKTPLLLLLLLSTLTWTVLCHEDDGTDPEPETKEKETEPEDDGDAETEEPLPTDSDATSAPDPPVTEEKGEEPREEDHGSGKGRSSGDDENIETTEDPNFTGPTITPTEEGLIPMIILIPVVLAVVIIGMIVCGIFINRRWNKKVKNQELQREDPYLDGYSTEKVPMPMFEEDVPSVLELEMEELDQWMKKDGDIAEDSKHP